MAMNVSRNRLGTRVKRAVPLPLTSPMFDVGANLTSAKIKNKGEVLSRAKQAGVSHAVVISKTLDESRKSMRFCRRYQAGDGPVLGCTIGCHPNSAGAHVNCSIRNMSLEQVVAKFRDLIDRDPGVAVAVGECGLDYVYDFSLPEDQLSILSAQLELSIQTGLPLFLHLRGAVHDDFCSALDAFGRERQWRGVIHCYSDEDPDHVDKYLSYGFSFGLSGIICDDKADRAQRLQEIIPDMPLDRILIQSVSPFLLPKNMDRKAYLPRPSLNEPAFLSYVATKVAECYTLAGVKMSPHEVALHTTRNAHALFNMGGAPVQPEPVPP
ncbi:unnamed protein product (mitochondrion) [Plasmodiophora brassicae]|uniref:TatD related DNase n=1 Tax=Plasmodiophora brassicae TaxID=37360 RepID=A0A0G4IHG2_PLABS|nr:hypothetical protein PBRA_000436 [Plasmodiophora brassicae]SPQ93085.1 unnamed protein product [Plasmodiophora brassicae]